MKRLLLVLPGRARLQGDRIPQQSWWQVVVRPVRSHAPWLRSLAPHLPVATSSPPTLDKNGKALTGAAKKSFLQKCEREA